ncbi:16S rRNA (guanine(966)-N(2))-methyltransferase RsmD [Candidatus Pelagibacter bacterium]|jgi:16S rRNA (guanine966-N2)-methyltransferase|nr:16S rRNA (guanine(966)-N(2))-methyltransferase RsmD [Candidatus Pelagibacter bacterium]
MRVIGGKFKGKKLLEPKDKQTRPLKDLTKESVFNIINHSNKFSIDIKKAYVLDLFSGVGSFGIECLSQGASYVTFIEKYKGVLPILKKNISNLKSEINYEIIESDILNEFKFKSLKFKYDIIFLDPPYQEKTLENILNTIIENNILKDSGIIIIHRHKNEVDEFPKNFLLIDEKKYGISKIIFGSYS